MRRLILIIPILIGCKSPSLVKTFAGSSFSTESYHMVGPSKIFFFKDSFLYIQNTPGRTYSRGTYEVTSSSQQILLKSIAPSILKLNVDSIFIDFTDQRIEIISRNKLEFKNQFFLKQKKKP